MPHVHLIDDDPVVRGVMARVLTEAGWKVSESDGGYDAVADVAREQPDVVLLDVTMPGPDGWTVLQQLRSAVGDVRVMMLTGRSTHEDVIRSRDAGADDFVAKAVAPQQLIARLNALLQRPPGDRDLLL